MLSIRRLVGMSSSKSLWRFFFFCVFVAVLCVFVFFFFSSFFHLRFSHFFFCELHISPFPSKSFLASEACCQKSHQVKNPMQNFVEGFSSLVVERKKTTSWFGLALLGEPPEIAQKQVNGCEDALAG